MIMTHSPLSGGSEKMAGLNIIEDVQFYYSSNRYSMVQKCMILIVDHHYLVVGVVSNVSVNCSHLATCIQEHQEHVLHSTGTMSYIHVLCKDFMNHHCFHFPNYINSPLYTLTGASTHQFLQTPPLTQPPHMKHSNSHQDYQEVNKPTRKLCIYIIPSI